MEDDGDGLEEEIALPFECVSLVFMISGTLDDAMCSCGPPLFCRGCKGCAGACRGVGTP